MMETYATTKEVNQTDVRNSASTPYHNLLKRSALHALGFYILLLVIMNDKFLALFVGLIFALFVFVISMLIQTFFRFSGKRQLIHLYPLGQAIEQEGFSSDYDPFVHKAGQEDFSAKNYNPCEQERSSGGFDHGEKSRTHWSSDAGHPASLLNPANPINPDYPKTY